MLYKVLKKDDSKEFLSKLISDYEFIGPVKKDRETHDFLRINDIKKLDTNYKRTTIAPAKKILFLPSETLIQYEINEDVKINPVHNAKEKILFGIDACDVNGMNFLDRFFSEFEIIDEPYTSRRKNLMVIGLDRMPSETNFSISMGMEYAKDGFDIFLTDLGNRYFVRVGTKKGNDLLAKYASAVNASQEDFKDYDKFMDDYRKSFKNKADTENFYDNYELIYDDRKFWDKVAKDCYSCGSCCLVCPTCFCFNVRDDMELNLKKGSKIREWDSCMIPGYGLVAGGHNFRPDKENRLKQRYRCKLKTFEDRLGTNSCVGCGRCIEACLAKINIAEDINAVKKEVSV
ncbi:MAG: 4Fe-4S dicluster domain-containing protein [Actinobacteria bacterium]|nr:4Fe-4S dicluster domain-containing protein [Actinomycetota bacterium]